MEQQSRVCGGRSGELLRWRFGMQRNVSSGLMFGGKLRTLPARPLETQRAKTTVSTDWYRMAETAGSHLPCRHACQKRIDGAAKFFRIAPHQRMIAHFGEKEPAVADRSDQVKLRRADVRQHGVAQTGGY